MIDFVEDWQARLRGRLYTQFADKPNFLAVVDAFAAQVQEIEGALQALARLPSIDPVTDDATDPQYWVGRAAQLDVIGLVVGQVRGSDDDATYRLRLRARIRANRSSGTVADLFAVMRALFGVSTPVAYVRGGIAEFVLRVGAVLTAAEAAVATGFLTDSKAAGVRAILEWQPVPDSLAFCFDGGDGLGFGDDMDPSVGGEFIDAIEA